MPGKALHKSDIYFLFSFAIRVGISMPWKIQQAKSLIMPRIWEQFPISRRAQLHGPDSAREYIKNFPKQNEPSMV